VIHTNIRCSGQHDEATENDPQRLRTLEFIVFAPTNDAAETLVGRTSPNRSQVEDRGRDPERRIASKVEAYRWEIAIRDCRTHDGTETSNWNERKLTAVIPTAEPLTTEGRVQVGHLRRITND
jgi:hypothetical protein